MAKIHWELKNGRKYYRLSVTIGTGRKRLILGYDQDEKACRKLEEIATRLESLKRSNEKPDARLTEVLSGLSEGILNWFAKIRLVDAPPPKLKEFMDRYIESKTGLAEHTIYKMKKSASFLLDFFGKSLGLGSISKGDVRDFINARRKLGKAEETIRSEVKHGRQFFKYAIEKRYVDENPFEGHEFDATDMEARKIVVPANVLADVLDAAPCVNWKNLLAVLRWTGCRLGEAFKLEWSHIDWNSGKIRITSEKTRKKGKGFRFVPLFPELRTILEHAWEQTGKEAAFVVNGNLRATQKDNQGRMGKNLGKPFTKIIEAAGHSPWVKPFQNLRVTRENELIRQGFALCVVEDWIGHTEAVAKKNYRTTIEADFEMALNRAGGRGVGSKPEREAAKGPEQEATLATSPVFQGLAAGCVEAQLGYAPRTQPSYVTILCCRCFPNARRAQHLRRFEDFRQRIFE